MKSITIAGRKIGSGEPVFVIAEACINHDGDFERAKEIIHVAKETGADCIKFQMHIADEEMLKESTNPSHLEGEGLYDLIKRVEVSKEEHQELKNLAEKEGIIFLSTPFSRKAADILEEVDVPAFKTGSGEFTNIPLLVHIAKKGRPMIISSGMSALDEVGETLDAVREHNDQVVLMQCTSEYPAKPEHLNLGIIPIYQEKFDVLSGLSDHVPGSGLPAVAATALGAVAVEKHFTVSREWPGPDQMVSLEPDEFKEMVAQIREVEKMRGKKKDISKQEWETRNIFSHSLIAIKDIPAGTVITEDMIWSKRPGTGIPAKKMAEVVGKKAKKEIKTNTPISWEDID